MAADNSSSKHWELTLYELHRKPQEPITDGTLIAVSPRSLKSELMCPICLDILKVTMTTKECLHRFCSECIITALRSGNKECPTCRKKLVSKRSLRRDPNFDALIAKIYPSRQDYEAQQDKILARLNRQHLSMALTRSLEQQLGLNSVINNGNTNPVMSVHHRGNNAAVNNTVICSQTDITDLITNNVNGIPSSNASTNHTNHTNTDNEEDLQGNFGHTRDASSNMRRNSHLNSDTESGMETNSVGETSSASDLPGRSEHGPATANNSAAGTNSYHMLPVDGHQTGHFGGNVINSAVSNSSLCPEIEVLLKPHPHSRLGQCDTNPSTSAGLRNPSNTVNITSHDHMNGVNNLASNNVNGHYSNSSYLIKYLKAPTITTVDHLCRYLTVRVNLQRMNRNLADDNMSFRLYSYNEATNAFTCLDSHMSMEEISRAQFQGAQCLDLYYALDNLDDS